MNFLEQLEKDGHQYKKVASTKGDEHKGACPWCGGNDRFTVWPNHPNGKGGRYICRQCGKSGDAIQYLRDTHGLSFRDACRALGITPEFSSCQGPAKGLVTIDSVQPRKTDPPPEIWQQKAMSLVNRAKEDLLPSYLKSKKSRSEDLNARGLTVDTIKAFRLGWCAKDSYFDRAQWGLPEEINEKTGKPKKLWLPEGLIIPYIVNGKIVRLRIRRSNPGEYARYVVVSGSSPAPMVLGGGESTACIIVESELDALLIHQEAGDIVTTIALGSAQARPDATTAEILKAADTILLALDEDDAGEKEVWRWWKNHYPQALHWPVPIGKDPGEAFQAGLDIRAWVQAGLNADFCATQNHQSPEAAENYEIVNELDAHRKLSDKAPLAEICANEAQIPSPPCPVKSATPSPERAKKPVEAKQPTRPRKVYNQLELSFDLEQNKQPSPCFCCKGTDFWLSIYGKWSCRLCYPPACPELEVTTP